MPATLNPPATPSKPAAPAAPSTPAAPSSLPPRQVAPTKVEEVPTPTETAPAPNLATPFDDLQSLIDGADKKEPAAKPPEKKVEPAKPAEGAKSEPVKPSADANQPPVKAEDPKSARDLRMQYELQRDQVIPTLKKELEETKSKLASINHEALLKEKEAVAAELAAHKEQLSKAETELRFLDYSRSEEFKQRYEKPLKDAGDAALEELSQYTVELEDGSTRPATRDDFIRLLDMNPQHAAKQAREWFGDAASEVLSHRRKISDLVSAKNRAIREYQEKGKEYEQSKLTNASQTRDRLVSLWNSNNESIIKSDTTLYGEDEADPEGNELLRKSTAAIDAAFDDKRSFPPETRIKMLSLIRNQAAALPRTVSRLKTAQARITELEKELESYRESNPAAGGAGGAASESSGNGELRPAEEELTEMANAMRAGRAVL